jgi:hypothetical protein
MLKSVFATPIYVVSGAQCLGEAVDTFSSFSIEQYYQPEIYGVAGFTTYFDAAANEIVKGLIPNVIKFAEQHSRDYLEMIGYDVSTYDLNVCNMWLSRMRENSNHNFHTHTKLGLRRLRFQGQKASFLINYVCQPKSRMSSLENSTVMNQKQAT